MPALWIHVRRGPRPATARLPVRRCLAQGETSRQSPPEPTAARHATPGSAAPRCRRRCGLRLDGAAAEPADAPKTEPAEPKAAEPKAEPATEDPVEQDDLDKKSCAMSGPADASALGLLALAGIAGIRRRR